MSRPRVLLAEDHPLMARELRSLLARECDIVSVVHDGRALIALAAAYRPEVVVSDLVLPGLDGLAAAQTILAWNCGMRVVIVTIRDDPGVIRHAIAMGVLGYVLKCDAGDELVAAVRAALRGEGYVSVNAHKGLVR